jgi:addiction module HigA family antidote
MTKRNEYFPQSRPHPGKNLVEKLEEMGMSSKEFAECTDRPEQVIIAVLNGTGVITPDLAVQFEKVTRIPAHFWLNSQRNYDEFMAKKGHKKNLEKVLHVS